MSTASDLLMSEAQAIKNKAGDLEHLVSPIQRDIDSLVEIQRRTNSTMAESWGELKDAHGHFAAEVRGFVESLAQAMYTFAQNEKSMEAKETQEAKKYGSDILEEQQAIRAAANKKAGKKNYNSLGR